MNDGTWTRTVHFPVQTPSRDLLHLIVLVTFQSNLSSASSGLCCQMEIAECVWTSKEVPLSDFSDDSKPSNKAKFENSVLLVTGHLSFKGAHCKVRSVLDPTAQHFCLQDRLTLWAADIVAVRRTACVFVQWLNKQNNWLLGPPC